MFNDALRPLSKKALSSHMFVARSSSETSVLTSLCRNDKLTLIRSVECAFPTRVDCHRKKASLFEISRNLSGLYWADYMQFGPNGSVFIAVCYGLDGPRIESRRRVRFSAPVQTGCLSHPSSCTVGTGCLSCFLVVSGWAVALTTHPHPATRLKKE